MGLGLWQCFLRKDFFLGGGHHCFFITFEARGIYLDGYFWVLTKFLES
jgi:hypothetical protein